MILARRLAVIVLSSEETQHDDAWEELNESLSKVVQAYGPDLLEKEVYIAGPHGVRSWPAKHDPSYKFFTLSQLSDAVQIGCDYVSERIAKPSQSYTLLFIWCGNEHPDFEESLQVGKLRGAVDSHATLKAYLAWCGPGSTQKSSKFQQAFPNQLWLMRSSDDLRNTITYELKAPR